MYTSQSHITKKLLRMKKLYFLNFLILCFALASCNEDADKINSPIVGEWQQSYYVDDWDKDAVNTMVFRSDGSMTWSGTIRETDSEVDLGYQFYAEGSYKIEDGKVSVPDYEYFTTEYIASGSYVSKDELYANPAFFGIRPFEVNAKQTVLLFPGGCEGDQCFSDIEYYRVDN
jgi:hypothetical protein